jgi:hypothetical protein
MTATFDGVLKNNTTITPGTLNVNTSTDIKFGNGLAAFVGGLDEVRFSNVARIASGSIGYAVASYNNQKLNSTFITAASLVQNGSFDEEWDEQEWNESVISP